MELKNILTPWNWFKKEEEQQTVRPYNHRRETTPDHLLVRLQRDLDQLFEDVSRGFSLSDSQESEIRGRGGLLFPRLDIAETKNYYTITVEVPGIDEKDMDITVAEGTLTIRGEKRSATEASNHQFHRVERLYGRFQRVLSLPTDADEDAITAKFKNGILTLTVGKNPKAVSSERKIQIT